MLSHKTLLLPMSCHPIPNYAVFFYVSEKILKLATNISRDKLISIGTCFGKFTKTQLFRLAITALDFLAPYAKVSMAVLLCGYYRHFVYP